MYFNFTKQPIYEEQTLPRFPILHAALSTMNEACDSEYESAVHWCKESPPQEIAKSIEEEAVIYSTLREDEASYGPMYCEPPCDEHKIYAEFEGKRFRKLYHEEIWLDIYVAC